MPLFLMGCFPLDFHEVKRPLGTKSWKRPIKAGKRPIKEAKRPIKAMVLVGISVGCLMGCFRAPQPCRKTAPLKRPIKRSMRNRKNALHARPSCLSSQANRTHAHRNTKTGLQRRVCFLGVSASLKDVTRIHRCPWLRHGLPKQTRPPPKSSGLWQTLHESKKGRFYWTRMLSSTVCKTWVLPEDYCKKDPCNFNAEIFVPKVGNPCLTLGQLLASRILYALLVGERQHEIARPRFCTQSC